jgi:hypothetical protein
MRAWQNVPEIKQQQRERILGEKNHMFGKTHSEEMRKQISESVAASWNDEMKEEKSKWLTEQWQDPEYKKKMIDIRKNSEGWLNRDWSTANKKAAETRKRNGTDKRTPEQRKKMSDIRKARLASGEIVPWNKGLKNDPRCRHNEETRQKMSEFLKKKNPMFSAKTKKKLSDTINKKVKEGTWHTSLAKSIHKSYNGINLHGSWELEYAKFLDKNNIKWIRNKETFTYIFEEKERKYTPDFYLLETDEYVEIKGYKTKKDEAKWSQFPPYRKLKILMKEELKLLGVI